MNELQSVTDIDEVIKYTEREAEGCHQTASAFHTDEGVYIHEETRFQYKAILWENIHEWLEELKELRKKQLKPCPFCGSKKVSMYDNSIRDSFYENDCYIIECDRCSANIERYSITGVKRAWNRRKLESKAFVDGYKEGLKI